jgi:hypothetical protein
MASAADLLTQRGKCSGCIATALACDGIGFRDVFGRANAQRPSHLATRSDCFVPSLGSWSGGLEF